MKSIKVLIIILFCFQLKLCKNDIILHRCGVDDENYTTIPAKNYTLIEKDDRKLSDEEFKDFNIYLDLINIKNDIYKFNLTQYENLFIDSLEKAVETIQALLKVRKLEKSYSFSDKEIKDIKIEDWNKTIVGSTANDNMKNLGIDLIIFGRIDDKMDNQTLASAGPKYSVEETGQPLIGLVNINANVNYSKINSKEYFQSIVIHELTHILGFLSSYFTKYYHNIFNRTDENGIMRFYINSSKVLEVSKKYFNCTDIDGVELEEYGGIGTAGSHWEARILLGEYMNGVVYPEEQVISEFTLALLEDTGYYKANYYTGGLMRFGKNKGCDFVKKRCVNSNHEINPLFENEFFDSLKTPYLMDPSCSSGRQSRTYFAWWLYSDIPEHYKYFEKEEYGGYAPADYCPVSKEFYNETMDSYYTGHCSSKGNGGYGTQIYYQKKIKIPLNETHISIKTISYYNTSKELYSMTGETYSDHSFCYQSSLIKKDINFTSDFVRAICYESFCSDYSLTIKINDDYIVCPRTGGKIEVEGYKGFFLCPDYNLICSGTVICNDMFDCVNKKSKPKNTSYIYDYEIKTSQNIESAEIAISDEINNYELAENGICPRNCKHCLKKNICIKCRNNFNLVGSKYNQEIKCLQLSELKKGYYEENNIFYKCIQNCDICSDDISCDVCAEGLDYSNGRCDIFTQKCEIYRNDGLCLKCIDNFAFKEDDRTDCLNKRNFNYNYYTKDEGISYYSCEKEISGCSHCYYDLLLTKVKCNKCVSGYVLFEGGNLCLPKEKINNTFYYLNETNVNKCDNAIENCIECLNENYCLKCKIDYYMINDIKNKCIPSSNITKNEYYLNENKTLYFHCGNNNYQDVKNCKKCLNKTICTFCQENFTFINYVKSICVEKEILKDKYLPDSLDESNYIKCDTVFKNCDSCNNKKCLSCKTGFIFINGDYLNCIIKSSLDFEYYYTNDSLMFYSCKDDNHKNSEVCQKLNSKILQTQIPSLEGYHKPLCDLFVFQIQIKNNRLKVFLSVSTNVDKSFNFTISINLYKSKNTRNLQETYYNDYQVDLYINGLEKINSGDIFSAYSHEEFNESDRIVLKEIKNNDYGLKALNNDSRLLDSEETKKMIANNEIFDFSNIGSLSIKKYYIVSSTQGCNFDLISQQTINSKRQNITLKFIEKNDNNNNINVKCILSLDNHDKIPCSLEQEINNEYILDSYVGSNENGVFYIFQDLDHFQLKCSNENTDNSKRVKIIGIICIVLLIVIIVCVAIACGRNNHSKEDIIPNESNSIKHIVFQQNPLNNDYSTDRKVNEIKENISNQEVNSSIKNINLQQNNINDYSSNQNGVDIVENYSKGENNDDIIKNVNNKVDPYNNYYIDYKNNDINIIET